MKKISLVLIFALAVAFANAQDNKTTTTTTTKATTTQAAGNSRIPVKVADLPKTIQDDLTKTWADYTTKNAFKVEKNSVVTYKVLVSKDTTQLSLMYDSTGKFISKKSLNQKSVTKSTLVPSSTQKSNTVGIKKDSIKK